MGTDLVLDDEQKFKEKKNKRINSKNIIIQHDFTLGPWWPEETVDAILCIEVIEHITRNFHQNLMYTFKKGAMIFITYSRWGGWHHTEVHSEQWWKERMLMHGFLYSDSLTERLRDKASKEARDNVPFPTGDGNYRAQHLFMNLLVFINPQVASRPEHAHLLAEAGCFVHLKKPNVHCENIKRNDNHEAFDKLPKKFFNIPFKEDRHDLWEKMTGKATENDFYLTRFLE